MVQSVWGLPIVCYLFLGGLAGGLGSLTGLSVICSGAAAGRTVKCCGWISLACVMVGACFLLFDLGSPIRALWPAILLHPDSWISRGVWIIASYVATLLALLMLISRTSSMILARLCKGYRTVRDNLILVFSWLLVICGCLLGLYTGFLLGGSVGVPFWQSPFLPLLFLMSSLGMGYVTFRMCAAHIECGEERRLTRIVSWAGSVILLAECVTLVLFVDLAWLSADPAVHGSADMLLQGSNAPIFWWLSMLPVYVLAPLSKFLSTRRFLYAYAPTLTVVECIFALSGTFALRWCIVFSGMLVVQ